MATHEETRESGITDQTNDSETQLELATTEEDDYEQIQLELSIRISQYLMIPNKGPLKIVTVGRGSVGKSTLINNFLNLPTEQAAKARKSQRPVTTKVTEYESTIHDLVPVHIYDTPGLQDSRVDEVSVIEELRQKTEGSIDLLFYVASLNNRLEISDERIIEVLTNEFTPRIWERAVFILSFADQHSCESDYVEFTDESAEVLQEYICKQNGCENLVVKCIRRVDDRESVSKYMYNIAAIPTGHFEDGSPKHWKRNLLFEVFQKCSKENYIPLLLCTGHMQRIDQNKCINQNQAPDHNTSQPEHHRRNIASDLDQAGQREENTDHIHQTQNHSIVGDLAVSSVSVAVGATAGGVIAGVAGSTTVVSTTFMGITVGVETAAALNAVAGIVGATATKTVITTTAATTGVIGLGVAGGAVVAVGVGLGFKKYIWPIIKEKF